MESSRCRVENINDIDVSEESIRLFDSELLDILLIDRTTRKNIIWATSDYSSNGIGFDEQDEITPDLITGVYADLIQPRIAKSQNAQSGRTRDKAEVFTPSWICNKQNNLVDEEWFGRPDVFNTEDGVEWSATEEAVSFDGIKKNWRDYVDAQRLEISCGEAPYLVSRYDTVTGNRILLNQRIGLLDRKMRIIGENTNTAEDWLKWSQRAFESIYGYEYQGDNLLLARENLLYTYIDYYKERFGQCPSMTLLKNIAKIISWNIWQMDGLKYVVPLSCKLVEDFQMSLFEDFGEDDETLEQPSNACPDCARGNIYEHTGIYCKVMDWRSKTSVQFISMMKGGKHREWL